MKKTAIYLLLLLAGGSAFCSSQAKADAIVSVSAPGSATVGSTITVDVTITGATDLYAFQLDLGFDPSVLAATSVTEGSFLTGAGSTIFFPGTIDNVLGSMSNNADTLVAAIPGVTGDGILLAIQFSVIGTGTSSLTPENLLLLDSNFNLLNASSVDATITASTSTGTATPEPATFLLLAAGMLGMAALTWTRSNR
jgi:cohesin domain-containing protein/PEP-CTERM motif-containing protein